MSHVSLYRHVKHIPKSLSYGAYCQVYRYDAQHILKVMPSDTEEGIAPGQLREFNFYTTLVQPQPVFLTCEMLDLKLHVQKRATTLHLKMPQLADDMWKIPNKAFASKTALWAVLPQLVDHVTTALSILHDHGVLHRDIKPSNIMYDPVKSRFYLIDFGSVMFSCVKSREPGFCTYIYSAPEAGPDAGDTEYGTPSDVYSLSATLADLILQYHSSSEDLQDWTRIIKSHEFPPSLKHYRNILLQGVHETPEKRCSLNDLRKAFGLAPVKKIETLFVEMLPVPDWSVKLALPHRKLLLHLLANICLTQDWDKFTFLSAVQMMNDYLALPDSKASTFADFQHVALACLSLAEKTFEDRFLDLEQISDLATSNVKHSHLGTKFVKDLEWVVSPTSLFRWETEVWLSLKGLLRRRKISPDLLSVEWSDLLQKVSVQTL
jgi:serine/threonine protein kinase